MQFSLCTVFLRLSTYSQFTMSTASFSHRCHLSKGEQLRRPPVFRCRSHNFFFFWFFPFARETSHAILLARLVANFCWGFYYWYHTTCYCKKGRFCGLLLHARLRNVSTAIPKALVDTFVGFSWHPTHFKPIHSYLPNFTHSCATNLIRHHKRHCTLGAAFKASC